VIPADFRLYDVLNIAEASVDNAGYARDAEAQAAWDAACATAGELAGAGNPLSRALSEVLGAAAPWRADEPWRADLYRALDAACYAWLMATGGAPDLADKGLLAAADFAENIPCREPFGAVLAAIWDLSRAEVAA
jgi:hypothetical protein